MDAIQALRALEELETSRGLLYFWLSDALARHESVAAVFGRLALDQVARRNVIQVQTRIALRSSCELCTLTLDPAPLEEMSAAVAAVRSRGDAPAAGEAVGLAADLEARSLALYRHRFFAELAVHSGPFVATLRRGCERHLEQLGACRPPRPVEPEAPEPDQAIELLAPRERPTLVALEAGWGDRDPLGEAFGADREALRRVFDALEDGVYVVDRDRRVVYWNAAAARIAGFGEGEMVGRLCWDNGLCHVDHDGVERCHHGCPMVTVMERDIPFAGEVHLCHRRGHRLPVSVSVHPFHDATGAVAGAVHLFRECASCRVSRARLTELESAAYADPLTGLPNRRYLEQTLVSRLGDLERYGWSFAVLFVDVDRFKDLNDGFGHAAGDHVLRTVGATLSANLRLSDLVGRWGGDEFLVVLGGIGADQLRAAAAKLKMLVGASRYSTEAGEVQATVSVGATLARPQDTIDTLVGRVDELMYDDKRQGRSRVAVEVAGPESGDRRPSLARVTAAG